MPDTLPRGEVHVRCRLTESLAEAEIADAVAVLSADELARYRRFVFPRDRRDYAAAHALLRASLSCYADAEPHSWQFREMPGGKPALLLHAGMPLLSFNLSHTHGLVACAITTGSDVGIDVESVERRVGDGVAERFFSASENARLRECPPEPARATRFIELWTLKEAYVKAIGTGLSHPLDTIVFDVGVFDVGVLDVGVLDVGDLDVGGRRSVTFSPPPGVDAAGWQFALFAPTDRHRLAVAVRRDGPPVSIKLFPGQ